LKLTTPLPLPLAPLVIVSQVGAFVVAVHAHPVAVVTLLEPDAPAAAADRLDGEMLNEQVPAAWFTVNVWPPTDNEPLRA
jgi:hypothetical protein